MEQEKVKYINRVTVAINQNKSEVIMNLYQEMPIFGEDAITTGTEITQVGSFVMNRNMAEELTRILANVLIDSENKPEADEE